MEELYFDVGVEDEIYHYGTPRHSGRYPWGSGENPYQHEDWILNRIKRAKEEGYKTDSELAKYFNMTVAEFKAMRSNATAEFRHYRVETAKKLMKECNGNQSEVGRRMGVNESTVRNLLDASKQDRANMTSDLAKTLKRAVDSKNGYLMLGQGTNLYLDNISEDRMRAAVQLLTDKGYQLENIFVPQMGDGRKKTTVQLLCPPGTIKADIYKNLDKIKTITDFRTQMEAEDLTGMKTGVRGIFPPKSIDSSRVAVVYKEDGGGDRDGLMLLRRGVEDVSLGSSNYSQVRIGVDGTHYLKGMAMYGEDKDFPKGKDIIFFTSKSSSLPLKGPDSSSSILKPMAKDKNGDIDPYNPFNANIMPIEKGGQRVYTDTDGNSQLSVINKVYDEGSWSEWSRKLSSQFLSKQPLPLVKRQLTLDYDNKKVDFDEICALTNPVLKQKLLLEFADDCDSAAEDLKAAALPRQGQFVTLPIPEMPSGQVYAPQYENGEHVVLIRYPHQGVFEIPELVVNNNFEPAIRALGKYPIDAIGTNIETNQRMSGADYDGDSVTVIPVNSRVNVKSSTSTKNIKCLEDLKFFDPKSQYPKYEGMPKVCKENGWNQDLQMGYASNLITDMHLKGAPPEHIADAVKYAMVVIDAEKHQLNHKQAYQDCHIADLKKTYQGGAHAGASTLISRARSPYYTDAFDETLRKSDIDPETGIRIYRRSPETTNVYNKKTGEWERKPVRTKITKMKNELRTTKEDPTRRGDARGLSSGTEVEEAYADYANKMFLLGNQARKEYIAAFNDRKKANPAAQETYKNEIESLNRKLVSALQNAPRERMATIQANIELANYLKKNPDLKQKGKEKDLNKLKTQLMLAARNRYGAKGKDTKIRFTDEEWKAIQANAISPTKLDTLLNYADIDNVKQLATPRTEQRGLSATDKARLGNMVRSGNYTIKEMAGILGVSASTISKMIKEM